MCYSDPLSLYWNIMASVITILWLYQNICKIYVRVYFTEMLVSRSTLEQYKVHFHRICYPCGDMDWSWVNLVTIIYKIFQRFLTSTNCQRIDVKSSIRLIYLHILFECIQRRPSEGDVSQYGISPGSFNIHVLNFGEKFARSI